MTATPEGDSSAPWAELLGRPAVEAAAGVLGSVLTVRTAPAASPAGDGGGDAALDGVVSVRLTEVEAYSGEVDPGSHAFRGPTPRTEPMFEAGGRLYVYFTYGMHWCANLVCGSAGTASALLLRGGEVVAGHATARARRPAARSDRDLARGPARLAQALGLTGADSGLELAVGGRAELIPGEPVSPARVRTGPRVGVAGEGGDGTLFPWRFWVDGEPSVSVYRPAAPRRR
ncbi:DNA-3-methyladenine glycosylase [Georgenia subflava]|uniref:Putative 3-methyladenine DNA glycosylase n=1 Tax=Georgenia subflava TaxID=1622177 RepID=A0A6N7ET83_9MICO|nr:DNA-3-methyladenine glycosylase [Georgenia subflava]MPV38384.1 DNA-3-methyladenine glycosylase [Georgenia subflava]